VSNVNSVEKKTKDPYAFSRTMYYPKCAFAYLISIITTGAYLAKLTTAIGISDGMTGMLSSLASLACFFQFASVPLSYRKSSKGTVIFLTTLNNLLYSVLYMIPFMGLTTMANSAIFFICILSSMIMNQISAPLVANWFLGITRPEYRGTFLGINSVISNVCGLIFTFIASMVADNFTKSGNLEGMLITFSITILVLNILHFITLLLAKEKPRRTCKKCDSVIRSFKILIKNKVYRKYLLFFIVYSISQAIAVPFFGTYQIRELGLSMTKVTVIMTISSISAILFLSIFGNYARRHSLAQTMKIGLPMIALSNIFIILCTPKNGMIMFILYYIVYNLGFSAFSLGTDPIVLEMVEEKHHTSAIAIKNVIAGPLGFLTTTLLTPLLNYIQGNGNVIFGIHIYGQQLFAIIAMAVMTVSSIMFYKFARLHTPITEYGSEVKDRI